MPDKFVPVDTSDISPYFMKVSPFIYPFALKYTEMHRETLKKYTEPREIEKYLDKQDLLNQFIDYVSGNGVKADQKGLNISGMVIHTQLKSYIARNILDNKGFYPIREKIDTTLLYAIDFLEK